MMLFVKEIVTGNDMLEFFSTYFSATEKLSQ